jgi:hypothetical protein
MAGDEFFLRSYIDKIPNPAVDSVNEPIQIID